MAFMVPEYTCEDFVRFDARGECGAFPRDVMDDDEIRDLHGANVEIETIRGKWWARLSASGYMDATDWIGPFFSEAEARVEIEKIYDVDDETGEPLDLTIYTLDQTTGAIVDADSANMERFLRENEEDEELCAKVRALDVDGTVTHGGGASPLIKIERLA